MLDSFQEKYQAFIDLAVRDFLSSCRAETSYFSMTKKLQETTATRWPARSFCEQRKFDVFMRGLSFLAKLKSIQNYNFIMIWSQFQIVCNMMKHCNLFIYSSETCDQLLGMTFWICGSPLPSCGLWCKSYLVKTWVQMSWTTCAPTFVPVLFSPYCFCLWRRALLGLAKRVVTPELF